MFNMKKKPSASNPVPAIRRYRIFVREGDSGVVVQEFSGPDMLPDEPIKFALSLFASSICDVVVLIQVSSGKWSSLVSLLHHEV